VLAAADRFAALAIIGGNKLNLATETKTKPLIEYPVSFVNHWSFIAYTTKYCTICR